MVRGPLLVLWWTGQLREMDFSFRIWSIDERYQPKKQLSQIPGICCTFQTTISESNPHTNVRLRGLRHRCAHVNLVLEIYSECLCSSYHISAAPSAPTDSPEECGGPSYSLTNPSQLHTHATLESELKMDPLCLLTLEFFSTDTALMDGQRKDATHSTIWLMPCPLLMNYAKLCPGDRSHMFIMKAAGVLDVP